MQLVMLHGLYMHHTIMRPLAALMRNQGWQVDGFSYNSLAIDPDVLFRRLDRRRRPGQPMYLLGHSLGGVLIRQYAEQHPLPPGSRLVTLGSPHQGATVTRQLQKWNLLGLLGNAHEHGLLPTERRDYNADTPLGSLAGDAGIGMGKLLTNLSNTPNDGTVTVDETRIDGMSDHIVLPVSHTSMLLSAEVARQTHLFLSHGHFQHQPVEQ
ncbi:esterase/lipase family protein [Ferrimonas kyonanensis]|uniref:esterase/lipase family protein n=1 Tax=Ferrimonas kyonanensis TaxID=364763 RepID=UPI00041A2E66|nr:alpha/beta hydrolase [Ferrimonas kyonanensis]